MNKIYVLKSRTITSFTDNKNSFSMQNNSENLSQKGDKAKNK